MQVFLLWTIIGGIGIAFGTFFNIWIQLGLLALFIVWANQGGGLEAIFPIIVGSIFFIGVAVGDISYSVQTQNFKTVEYSNYNPFVVTNVEYDRSKIPEGVDEQELVNKAVAQAIAKYKKDNARGLFINSNDPKAQEQAELIKKVVAETINRMQQVKITNTNPSH